MKILIFGETATFSHVVRPALLADMFAEFGWDVHFALEQNAIEKYKRLTGRPDVLKNVTIHNIENACPIQFSDRLAKAKPIFREEELWRYVSADLKLIGTLQPDIILGDFRISLTMSAKFLDVPYINLVNAFWSSHLRDQTFPFPDHKARLFMKDRTIQRAFDLVGNRLMNPYLIPFRNICKKLSLDIALSSLRDLYHSGNSIFMPDLPELYTQESFPHHCGFIGDLDWQMASPTPSWWEEIRHKDNIAYYTIGSSGSPKKFDEHVRTLINLGFTVVATTAGRLQGYHRTGVYLADFLPLDKILAKAKLAVGHGGASFSYPAIKRGVPVIGCYSNMDQALTMRYVQRSGFGFGAPLSEVSANTLAKSWELLNEGQQFKQELDKLKSGRASPKQQKLIIRRAVEKALQGAEIPTLPLVEGGLSAPPTSDLEALGKLSA